MAEPFLTRHAIERYRERVADLPTCEIRRALDCPAVRAAIDIGARYVKLSGGQRAVLEGERIITILPRDHWAGCLDPARDHLFEDGQGYAQG